MAVTAPDSHPAPRKAPRRVTILGSTGSVGCNTIDLIDRNPDAFEVVALTAGSNVALLAEQALRLRPEFVALADPGGWKSVV